MPPNTLPIANWWFENKTINKDPRVRSEEVARLEEDICLSYRETNENMHKSIWTVLLKMLEIMSKAV